MTHERREADRIVTDRGFRPQVVVMT